MAYKKRTYWEGFTLIEAIIALMIFAMAGVFLISTSAANFRNIKLNELRSQMENLAIDGASQVRLLYNNRWENLPAGNDLSFYPLSEVKNGGVPNCRWVGGQERVYLDDTNCEIITRVNNGTFVRAVSITDATKMVNGVNLEAKQIEVIVSCRQGRCDGTLLPPYTLRYLIYR